MHIGRTDKKLEMKEYVLSIAVFFATIHNLYSQKIIRGKVIEQQSNIPISFVNIGIVNSSIGTISNQDGTFIIKIPESRLGDTVTFSAIGYVRRQIPIGLLQENDIVNIFLNQRTEVLGEVIIFSKKEKRKNFDLGNRYYKGGLNLCPAEDATAGPACLAEPGPPSATRPSAVSCDAIGASTDRMKANTASGRSSCEIASRLRRWSNPHGS